MSFPPFTSLAVTLRVILKALLLMLVINFICLAAHFDPVSVLTRINLWGLVGQGRDRLIYQSDLANGQLPVASLIVTHKIAYTPKAADEFRVVILGNSGPYGAGLNDDETLAAQLNRQNLLINGKRLVAYNLAYPNANVVELSTILDAALAYKPDLAIAFVTANMFNNRQTYWDQEVAFFLLNRDRVEQLAAQYGMTDWLAPRLSPRPPGYNLVGIHDQGKLTVWFGSLFYPFVQPQIPHPDWRIANDPIPAAPNNFETVPGTYPVLNPVWQFLDVDQQMMESVGGRLLVINQPNVVVDSPYSDVSYSRLYGRAFYDTYYETIQSYTASHNLWYEDMWRLVPASHYTDSELHIDAQGWGLVADQLSRQITDAYTK